MSGINYVNHVVFVVDESSSMHNHKNEVVRVVDREVAHLARRSQELDQETRVSVYTFNSTVPDPIFYDKDVLRLPSIANHYRPGGRTALIDATIKSLDDLGKTAQLYGDHAFLVYVVTDGEENQSRLSSPDLQDALKRLPEEWTVAVLVPNMRGKHWAQQDGFAPNNIAIWDPNASDGVEDAGRTIRTSTDDWMADRARGKRGTKALFSTGVDAVNAATVRSSLTPLGPNNYDVLKVHEDSYIKPFIESKPKMQFDSYRRFYQLTKTETIQSSKRIAVRERQTGAFYTGPAARDLLGLPGMDVRVKPDYNPEYDVFVESTSVNRRLIAGTELLLLPLS